MKAESIVKKFLGFSVGPLLSAVFSFITVPITTYLISPEEFGKASFFTVSITLALSIIYLGIDQSFARDYFNVKDKNILYLNAIFLPFALAICISTMILIFQKEFLLYLFGNENYRLVPIMFCSILFLTIIERFTLMSYRMEEKAFLYSVFSVTSKFFTLIFTIFFLIYVQKSFISIVYATFIGQLLSTIILVIFSRKYICVNMKYLDLKLIKSLLNFGFPMLISALVATFLNTGGQFFLRFYGNFNDVGMYAAALKITAIINIIQGSFTSFWIPLAYRWNNENVEMKYFKRISDILTFILALIFTLILIFKNYLILILSPDYAESARIVGLLALTPIMYTLSEATTLGIVFSRKSYYSFISSTIALGANLSINFYLVPFYGVYGAAFAQAAAFIVFYFSKIYFSKKEGFFVIDYRNLITIGILFVLAILNTSNYEFINILNIVFIGFILLLYHSNIIDIFKYKMTF